MVYTKALPWIKKTNKKSHIAKVTGRPLRPAQRGISNGINKWIEAANAGENNRAETGASCS